MSASNIKLSERQRNLSATSPLSITNNIISVLDNSFVTPTSLTTTLNSYATTSSLGNKFSLSNSLTSETNINGIIRFVDNVNIHTSDTSKTYYCRIGNPGGSATQKLESVQTGSTGWNTFNTGAIGLHCDGAISATIGLCCSSDIRIKQNIQDINDNLALSKIIQIKPKTYNYIDSNLRGKNKVYGFLAQEIGETIPEAITIRIETIPNIFKICEVCKNIISLSKEDIKKLKLADEIEIIFESNYKRNFKVIEINDDNIKINEDLNEKQCFVYGTIVNDFHNISYDYIFTLNVSATKELYKLIQLQNTQIYQLNEQIQDLKQRIDFRNSQV